MSALLTAAVNGWPVRFYRVTSNPLDAPFLSRCDLVAALPACDCRAEDRLIELADENPSHVRHVSDEGSEIEVVSWEIVDSAIDHAELHGRTATDFAAAVRAAYAASAEAEPRIDDIFRIVRDHSPDKLMQGRKAKALLKRLPPDEHGAAAEAVEQVINEHLADALKITEKTAGLLREMAAKAGAA